jgi:hypothetical protein
MNVQTAVSTRVRQFVGALFITSTLVLPSWLAAQTAPSPSTAAAEETIRLSPFDTTEERDGSFQSNSVGSGSRLKLDLKDTPVAYSVINREFIDALGISNLNEAATWATGQTFYAPDNGGAAFGRPSQYISRGNVTDQGGANQFGAQRNFYQNANISGDSYSVESYDFGRGPNAALFGQGGGGSGGLAGVSSIQSKKTRFDRSSTTTVLELGQWGYHRETLDYNRPINDRFGIRLNLVDSNQPGWRDFDMKSSRGITLTSTWKVTNSTELTLEVSGDHSAFHTVGGGMDEYVSGWDGSTVFRGPINNAMYSTNATIGATSVSNPAYGTLQVFGGTGLTFGGAGKGVDRSGALTSYRYDAAEGTVMNWQNFAISRRADDTSRTPLWTRTAPNGAFFVRGTNVNPSNANLGTDVVFNVGRGFYVKQNMPADMFHNAIENSKFRIPSERRTYSVDMPTVEQRTKDITLGVTQRIGSNLYLDIGGNANRAQNDRRPWDNPTGAAGGGRTAALDLNQIRPDGSPNKHFLDSFSALQLQDNITWTSDQAIRANAAYLLNANRWGNYTFNLNVNASQRFFKERDYTLSLKANADPRKWGADQLRMMVYQGDSVRGYTEPINGKTVQFTDVAYDASNNPTAITTSAVAPNWVLVDYNESFFQARYGLLQMTGKWWGDRVIFTGAFRRDVSKGTQKSSLAGGQGGGGGGGSGALFVSGDFPVNWDGSTAIYRPDAPADYFKMTYVQVNTATGVPLTGKAILSGNRPRTNSANGLSIANPQYVGRFRDDYNAPASRVWGNTYNYGLVYHATDWFSPFYNFSNSFVPPTGVSLDLNGVQREPTKAYGFDWGAQLSFFKSRLNIKYNYFVNVRENDANTPGTSSPIGTLYAANFWTDPDTTSSGRNIRGVSDLPGNDYQKRRNFGYEIEVTANLAKGLRVTANGSVGSFSVSDISPLSLAYVPANAAVFKQLLEDAGGSLDPAQKPLNGGTPVSLAPGLAVATPIAGNGIGVDTTSAVNAYNSIWIAYETIVRGRAVRTPNTPQMNIFADYTIQSGFLSNLRIGAGIQWQGRNVIGNNQNATILDPNNPIPTAIDDPTKDQFSFNYDKGSYLTQANFSYPLKLKNGKNLMLSLRVNNPVNDKRMFAGTAAGQELRQPNGDLTKPNRSAPVVRTPGRFSDRINARLSATYTFGGSGR